MLSAVIIVIGIAIDQITKIAIINWLSPLPSKTYTVIDGVLSFSYCKNTGISFSFLDNIPTVLLVVLILMILIGTIICLIKFKKEGRLFSIGLAFIISGAVGNLLDRIFRIIELDGVSKGYVVDFIRFDFMTFPVFNFADICITTGTCLLIIYGIIEMKKEFKKKKLLKQNGK
ncbi:MAG: signal peptidase II [Eubacteriales bacterium]